MSLTNAAETAQLQLLFTNTNWANVGDATGLRGATTAGSFHISLHTAIPGEVGTQTTSETAYTNYARVAVARSGAGFTVSGNQVSNAAAVAFPQCGATGATIVAFGIGTDPTGAGNLLAYGVLGSSLGPFTATAADVITLPGLSGVVVDDRITFKAGVSGVLPTGVTEDTIYFVKTVATNDITISTTQGGATLDITAAGDGVAFKVTPLAVANLITPSFAIGQLVVVND